jgi:hypothetical protein
LTGDVISYDLKGSTNSRRKLRPGDEQIKTKMDVEFVEAFQSIPLCLRDEQKLKMIDYAINNDSFFLCN